MKSKMCAMFGIDVPIFAFSHCRDVVVEVSKAGGMGVLGMARMSPERVEEELNWIDAQIGDKPYGIDVLMPSNFDDSSAQKYNPDELLPKEHVDFVRNMLDEAGVPPLPEGEADQIKREIVKGINFTPSESLAMVETAMRHPIKLIVNALVLGCEGVWTGSLWLKTVQSEVTPEIKQKMFEAEATDAILTTSVTGKPCRTLRNRFSEAYEAPGAPATLPAPTQNYLWWQEGRTRVERVRAKEFLTYPVGQIVGDMEAEISVREVV